MKFKVPKSHTGTPEEVKLVSGTDVLATADVAVSRESPLPAHPVSPGTTSQKSGGEMSPQFQSVSTLFGQNNKKSNFMDVVRQVSETTPTNRDGLPKKSSDFGGSGAPTSPPEGLVTHDSGIGSFSRKGSYNQDGAANSQGSTRGRWFAVKQMTSLKKVISASSRKAKPEDLITREQVKTYHELLQITKEIQGLHACVDHPCGNIYWDFQKKQCLPGRVFSDTMPEDVRVKIDRDFTEDEVREIEDAIHMYSAQSQPEQVDPRALFVIGPAAAGKSAVRMKTEEMLQINLADYVEIDGDEFRDKHKGWMDVLESNPTQGYKDALSILLPYTRSLKKKVLEYAMSNRKNILLPSTGSNFEKLLKEVEAVRARGYRVDVIGLVVSYHETRARALNRAHVNGRWNVVTWKKWEAAMHAVTYFMDPTVSDWCIVFDNHDFTNPTTIYTRTHNLTFVESIVEEYRRMDQQKERELEENDR